ncbi:MAG: hypothetical protein PVI86_14880 [Phycisphaerae bacterium]|jgi:hypothetical protein
MNTRRRLLPLTLVVALVPATLAALVNASEVSYQGELLKDELRFSGAAGFKFVIVDASGESVWSCDGSSVGGSEPAGFVSVPVDNGLFNTQLGSETEGMIPIDAVAFRGREGLALRVWVDTGDGFELLPDQPIGSSVSALQSGATEQIAEMPIGAVPRWDGQALSEGAIYQEGGKVGIGVGDPRVALDVDGDIRSKSIDLRYEPHGGLSLGATGSTFPHSSSLYFRGSQAGEGFADAAIFWRDHAIMIRGGSRDIVPFNLNMESGNLLLNAGRVGIGTSTPDALLDVNGAIHALSLDIPFSTGGGIRLRPGSQSPPQTQGLYFVGSDAGSDFHSSYLYWRNNAIRMRGGSRDIEPFRLDMESGDMFLSEGKLAIGTLAPTAAVHIKNPDGGHRFLRMERDGLDAWELGLTTSGYTGWTLWNASRGITSLFASENGDVGVGTNRPQGNVEIASRPGENADLLLWRNGAPRGVNLAAGDEMFYLAFFDGQTYDDKLIVRDDGIEARAIIDATAGIRFPDGTIQTTAGGGDNNPSAFCYWGNEVYSSGASCQNGWNSVRCDSNPFMDLQIAVFTCMPDGSWSESSSCESNYRNCGE